MAGTPARRIGWMSKAGGRLGEDFICPIEGTAYRLATPNKLEEII
jgi:UDP-2-acetamido-3-amino-2,3-dideoxy-glucuronate N-acetyltransferase